MKKYSLLSLVLIGLSATTARAATITVSGYLNDSANPFLVGPDAAPLNAPSFIDDFAIANNAALHPITVSVTGLVTFTSLGFAAGGVDPYFTLFSGIGPGALFVDSNFDEAFSTGGDFSLTFSLAAGDYTLAIGTFANMSFAENNPDAGPTLGDGFTALGAPLYLGAGNPYYYELAIDSAAAPVAEPACVILLGLSAVTMFRSRRSRGSGNR